MLQRIGVGGVISYLNAAQRCNCILQQPQSYRSPLLHCSVHLHYFTTNSIHFNVLHSLHLWFCSFVCTFHEIRLIFQSCFLKSQLQVSTISQRKVFYCSLSLFKIKMSVFWCYFCCFKLPKYLKSVGE